MPLNHDNQLLETYKELTAGLHKTGLAVQGIAVTQEGQERRLSTLEQTLNAGDGLQTRVGRLEDRLLRMEKQLEAKDNQGTALQTARIQSRSTVFAAWIGAIGAVIAAAIAIAIAAS